MPTWLLVTILLLVGCGCTAYTTALMCNKEYDSEWQEITYVGNSVEPKSIYVCKRCNYKADLNHHCCSNCGSTMKNGMSYHCYSDKIKLSE